MPRRGSIGLVAVIGLGILLVAFALLDVSAAKDRQIAGRWRTHTFEVLLVVERFRHFSAALRPTDSRNLEHASSLLRKMQRQTMDNSRQQRNIALLATSFAASIAIHDGARGDTATRRSASKLDERIERVANEEQQLWILRTAAVTNADRKLQYYAWSLSALAIIMVLASVALAIAMVRSRDRAEAGLAERKRVEEELANTGAILRAFVETISGPIYAKDIAGRLILANPPALALIGKPWSEIDGRTDAEILNNAEEGAAIMLHDRRIMDEGVAETIEEQISFPDGTPAIWLSTKAPLYDSGGEVVGLVGMSVDITERREDEARLRALQDELWRAARFGAMGELSLALAHEMNQPLAAIMNHLAIADHIVSGAGPINREDLARRLSDTSEQVMRAGGIIKRLHLFVEDSKADKQPQRASEVIAEAAHLASLWARRQNVTLAVADMQNEAIVFADRIQIQQALLILVHTAIEALQVHGVSTPTISMSMTLNPDNGVEIVINFNGPGIDSAIEDNLVQRYSTASHWSGLGISNCRRVIEAHGGRLAYATEIMKGARFTITLPLIDKDGALAT